MNTVTVGLVGGGYAAQLHCEAYKKVSGVNVRLKTIADIDLSKAKKLLRNIILKMPLLALMNY